MPIWLTESRKTRRAGRFAGQATAPMPYRGSDSPEAGPGLLGQEMARQGPGEV